MKNIMDYSPVILLDKNEPFSIKAIGYTVFTSSKKSDSFPKRFIEVTKGVKKVYEFAIWFDYDIQHLYELEHVWVYIGNDNSVIKVEGSFHGKYLNVLNIDTRKPDLKDNTHPIIYMQPGKHAVLSDPRLIYLVPDWYEACNEKAGIDGVDIHEFYADKVNVDLCLQDKVRKYIKDNFSFSPSLEFIQANIEASMFMTWEELRDSIPERINKELERIKNY